MSLSSSLDICRPRKFIKSCLYTILKNKLIPLQENVLKKQRGETSFLSFNQMFFSLSKLKFSKNRTNLNTRKWAHQKSMEKYLEHDNTIYHSKYTNNYHIFCSTNNTSAYFNVKKNNRQLWRVKIFH